MARVTIEECWWTDPRREKLARLLGSTVDVADAAAIRAWRLAQEFWGRGQKHIPPHIFEALEAASKLIEASLAVVKEDGVYIRGSCSYLEWLNEKRTAASIGGKKSAETRRKKHGTAQPKGSKTPKQRRSTPEADSNEIEANSNRLEPSGSGSGSGSDFGFDSDLGFGALRGTQSDLRVEEKPIDLIPAEKSEPAAPEPPIPKSFIATYVESYRLRYGSRPDITGKDAGIAKRLIQGLGLKRARELIETYLAMNDSFFITKAHDLTTFESNLKKVGVMHDTGRSATRKDAIDAEKTQKSVNAATSYLKTKYGEVRNES